MPDVLPGLYVVATPIGNLGDLSPRASAVLAAAAVVAAEDTRTSAKLVRGAGGTGRLVSLTEHNVEARAPGLIEAARAGAVALVSDAGTPGVADPGARLVAAAHRAGIPVIAIPGPSALAAAISVSGFDAASVIFLGFLPKARGERSAVLRAAATASAVVVFFESPRRLASALADVAAALDDPEVVVCRELTKLHEEVVRGPASVLAGMFGATLGECTVVVQSPRSSPAQADAEAVRAYLAEMQRAGARRSAAAAEAAARFGIPRQDAYRLWPEAAADAL